MTRIFLPSISDKEPTARITGENARYLISVLRAKTGRKLIAIDAKGNRHRAEVKEIRRGSLLIELKETLPPEPGPNTALTLLQGVLKGQKMDLVIQKAAELGVGEVIPLLTERTQVRETRKTGRWRKIAVEASRQSGRTAPPEIRVPVEIKEFFVNKNLPGFIFWEEGGLPLREAAASVLKARTAPERIYLAIGPEGGFAENEVRLAEGSGLTVTTLGRRILRAETAAISTVSLVQFLLEEI